MMKKYKEIVGKRIPNFIDIRWNVKYNILRMFVEHHTDISSFLDQMKGTKYDPKIELDRADLNIAQLLVDIMRSFDKLTRFMSQNISLAPVYVPLLCLVGQTIETAKLKFSTTRLKDINLGPVYDYVNKYLEQVADHFALLYSCSALVLRDSVVEQYYENVFAESVAKANGNQSTSPRITPVEQFTDVIMMLGKFKTGFRESDVGNFNENIPSYARPSCEMNLMNEGTTDTWTRTYVKKKI